MAYVIIRGLKTAKGVSFSNNDDIERACHGMAEAILSAGNLPLSKLITLKERVEYCVRTEFRRPIIAYIGVDRLPDFIHAVRLYLGDTVSFEIEPLETPAYIPIID